MKQQKHKTSLIRLISLFLATGILQSVSAQLFPGYLSGMATIGENPTLLNGNLVAGSESNLFLGPRHPRGQQINTLYIVGSYTGETGARTHHSITNNTNTTGTRGFIDIAGAANGATEIIPDMFDNWDGACIDMARAYAANSDANAFRMAEADYNGRRACLKTRIAGNDIIWFIAEHTILNTYLSPDGQNRCAGSSAPFDPLTVTTPSTGNYHFQWYKCDNNGNNLISLGQANGAQTASYTPPATTEGTNHYRCIVSNAFCTYNSDTTAVSGAITVNAAPKMHIFGSNLCIGSDALFTAEIYEGDTAGTKHWHISEGMAASIDENTGRVTAQSTGRFTVTCHYTTPGGCSIIETSQEYEVFAKPVSEVQDIILCSAQTIPASSLVKNLLNADTYNIYDSTYNPITGENILATNGTATYYVEAINTNCHCVAGRIAVLLTVTDEITFNLPSTATICSGSTVIDLSAFVNNVNVNNFRIEVYKADGSLLPGSLVPASEQPYFVKIISISGNCESEARGITVSQGSSTIHIVEQPQPQTYCPACEDNHVTFTVKAEGSNLTCQWYETVAGTSVALAGETSNTLTLPVSGINPSASYYVAVTGGCDDATTTINSNAVKAETCLDLLIQKKNHTLEVNNNPDTNGGYKFTYYEWYKNSQMIHKGAYGEDKGGYYYTGARTTLDPDAEYYVLLTDRNGRKHHTCPLRPTLFLYDTKVMIYPNPASHNSPLVAVDIQTDDEELLEKGVINIYNSIGQNLGHVRTEGHRLTPVQLPPVAGVYVLKLTSGEFEEEVKVIVK